MRARTPLAARHYDQGVAKQPRLILLHGTRFDSRQWDAYPLLCPGIDLATLDLPGHGTRIGEPWSMDTAVALLADRVRELAEDGAPVVVAGHSLGGYVATCYAQANPSALAGLILIGATADPSRHRFGSELYSGFARLLPLVGPERMARFTNSIVRTLGAKGVLPGSAAYPVLGDAWASVMARARASQLQRVGYPVFLMAGQFDQLGVDLPAYADACQRAYTRIIPRVTHLMPLTHPRRVAAAITEAVALATA